MYKPIAICGGVALLAGALSACAPAAHMPPGASEDAAPPTTMATPATPNESAPGDPFAYRAAELTMLEGLQGISQRYIEPVDMDYLALGGLRGLATIDPKLRFSLDATKHELRLDMGAAAIARLKTPDTLDAAGWARLSSDVLRTGRVHSRELRNADNERVFEAIFDGMLSSLDIFSRYAGAEEARANRAKRDGFGGIGIRFAKVEDGILITHVSADGPAVDAGLKPGDVIVRVDDTDIQSLKLRDVAKLLRGPVGASLTISVARLSGDANAPERRIDFNLRRAHIVPETVRTTFDGGLMVITISSFNKNTSPSVHDALRANDQAMRDGSIQGIVMDLRGNPGGLLSQSVNVADLFLDEGHIISTRGRHPDSFHDYRAGGVDLARGLPLAILVDGESASAAEIVASALQDLGRAVVIGSASYGKGTVQTVIRLPNDGEVTLTWSRFVSPSGYAIHGLGVMPAVCATNTGEAPGVAPDRLTAAILAPEHIDGSRGAMDAWRAAGQIFDGRRRTLRDACPARSFKPGKDGDLLLQLADRVIHEPTLYERALLLSQPVNTASR